MVQYSQCIGCQACVDLCPQKAISFQYDSWGEGRAVVDPSLCNDCHLCEARCPALHNKFNPSAETVFAAYSAKHRATGSSGGIFYELASDFIGRGGVVFGAAFDSELRLIHQSASRVDELPVLCKSKYLHSDMKGVYSEIADCLKKGLRVMFVGTPCQVSAVKNSFAKYGDRLLLVDFLCHGTGTQRCFDLCVANEEKKKRGKIVDFTFRAKTRRAEHSFRYRILRNGKEKTVTGYSFEFPYYFSYLKYGIFCEACYECGYAKKERVGDITLGDFWGIQNYNRKLKDFKGVSMLSVNTEKGRAAIEVIRERCRLFEEPMEHASAGNVALRGFDSAHCREQKHRLAAVLREQGEDALVQKLSCTKIRKEVVYANTPMLVKKTWSWIKGKL